MRPTKELSDLEFWTRARQYWAKQLEFWFLWGAKAQDSADKKLAEAGEKKARDRLFAAELCHQEALGEIIVYSGRAKPEWALSGARFAHSGGDLQ